MFTRTLTHSLLREEKLFMFWISSGALSLFAQKISRNTDISC